MSTQIVEKKVLGMITECNELDTDRMEREPRSVGVQAKEMIVPMKKVESYKRKSVSHNRRMSRLSKL